MRTFTKTAAALGLLSAILAGPAAEEARAEPISGLLITGAALGGGYGGAIVGSKIGIAALGTAVSGTVPVAIVGAAGGALSMKALLASLSAAAAKAGVVAATPVVLTAGGVWVVAGATVIIAAVVILDHWDEIVEAAEAAWRHTKAAAVWTASITADGFEATWNGMKWTAGATAEGSVAAWTWTVDTTRATGRWFAKVGRATAYAAGAFWAAMNGDLPLPGTNNMPAIGANGR